MARREAQSTRLGQLFPYDRLGRRASREGYLFHLILNAYSEPLEFELPTLGGGNSCAAGSTRRLTLRMTSFRGRCRPMFPNARIVSATTHS